MDPQAASQAPAFPLAKPDATEADQADGDEFIASVGFKISHPRQNLLDLTERLDLDPNRTWTVGTERFAPNGSRLLGLWDDSYWGASDEVTKKTFSEMVEHYIGRLMAASERIKELTSTGGWVMLDVNIHGKFHFGFVLTSQHLSQLAEVGATVGVEIFPLVNKS